MFKINEGKHYSNFNLQKLQPFIGLDVDGTFNIDISWWYREGDIPHSGWNKLCGVSETDIPFCKERGVHWNSGRLVFQPAKEYGWFDVAGYVYSEGVRTEVKFARVRANKDYSYSVTNFSSWDKWYFSVDNTLQWMDGNKPRGITRKCYPYFGGKSVAIRDCFTEVKFN